MIPELFQLISKVIAGSTAIDDFCNSEFSKKITVYVGVEVEQFPPEEDYPVAVVAAIEHHSHGERENSEVIECQIGVGIKSENLSEETIAETGVIIKTYRGVILVEKLRELLEREIMKVSGIGYKIGIAGETMLENYFPLFRSNTIISLEKPRSFRSGRGG